MPHRVLLKKHATGITGVVVFNSTWQDSDIYIGISPEIFKDAPPTKNFDRRQLPKYIPENFCKQLIN